MTVKELLYELAAMPKDRTVGLCIEGECYIVKSVRLSVAEAEDEVDVVMLEAGSVVMQE